MNIVAQLYKHHCNIVLKSNIVWHSDCTSCNIEWIWFECDLNAVWRRFEIDLTMTEQWLNNNINISCSRYDMLKIFDRFRSECFFELTIIDFMKHLNETFVLHRMTENELAILILALLLSWNSFFFLFCYEYVLSFFLRSISLNFAQLRSTFFLSSFSFDFFILFDLFFSCQLKIDFSSYLSHFTFFFRLRSTFSFCSIFFSIVSWK